MVWTAPQRNRLRSWHRLEQLVRVVTGPLGSLCLALALALLCGFFVESRTFALAGALVVMLALGLCYPLLAVRMASGSVGFPVRRLREGEPLRLQLALKNRGVLPLWGLWIEGIRQDDSADNELFSLGSRQTQTLERERLACPRGRYPITAPMLCCQFPFGLYTARCPLACTDEALVWPSYFTAPPLPEGGVSESSEGSFPSRKAGTSGDLMGVRDFRRGDSLRRIHWPQTARHDRLIVTEWQALRLPRVRIVLDLTGAPPGQNQAREWAIRAAMSLVEGWSGQGLQLEVALHDGTSRLVLGSLLSLRDALARLPQTPPAPALSRESLRSTSSASTSSAAITVVIVADRQRAPAHANLVIVAEEGGTRLVS